jgi:hypothetical protein
MKNEQTIAQFLNVTNFPFGIKDKNGNVIYGENSNEYWIKREYDDKGKEIRYENSDGYIVDNRPKPMIELSLEDIANTHTA